MPSKTLHDILYDIDQGLQQRGLPAMDNETLAEVSRHLIHPEVIKGFKSGAITTDRLIEESIASMRSSGQLPPDHALLQQAAEGGLINDTSGQVTNRIRRQVGIPSPNDLQQGGP